MATFNFLQNLCREIGLNQSNIESINLGDHDQAEDFHPWCVYDSFANCQSLTFAELSYVFWMEWFQFKLRSGSTLEWYIFASYEEFCKISPTPSELFIVKFKILVSLLRIQRQLFLVKLMRNLCPQNGGHIQALRDKLLQKRNLTFFSWNLGSPVRHKILLSAMMMTNVTRLQIIHYTM